VLPSGHGWVVQRHTMSVVPSATVLATIRQRGSAAPRALLAFAAPGRAGFEPLPNARAEADWAARRVGGGSAIIADADEAHVKRPDLGDYRVLHFAAHALVDERVPRRSAIVLGASGSEDGLLQVNEIAHLPLNADLVVLAACRTQMGHMLRAEGLLGLSRAFLQAGARSVVASLWDVKDSDSRALMDAFYGHLATGSTADAALRLAQMDVMRAADTTTLPAAWGAFVISGDGTRPVAEPALLRGSVPLLAVALAALFVLFAVAKGARP
jgi:CHAT domain-containing protein